jgi:hypothetical protein
VSYVHDAGTDTETVTQKTSVPLLRSRLETGQPDEVKRVFNLFADDIHAATLGSRSIPFGGPVVVLRQVAFTNGTALALAHRMKSDKAVLLFLSHPTGLSAGAPLAWVTSVDDANITLMPQGTFSADVVIGVAP